MESATPSSLETLVAQQILNCGRYNPVWSAVEGSMFALYIVSFMTECSKIGGKVPEMLW